MRFLIPVCFLLFLFSCASTQQVDVSKLLAKAEKGEVKAQYLLASSYEKGDGVQKDFNKALEWYEKAASNGYIPA